MRKEWLAYCFLPLSLIVSCCFAIFPWGSVMRTIWPDWILLSLIFWLVVFPEPKRFTLVFLLGLFVDLLMGDVLGMHAFSYIIVAYVIYKFSPRFGFLSVLQQMLIVFALALINIYVPHVVLSIAVSSTSMHNAAVWLGWRGITVSLVTAVVWPVYYLLYLRCRDALAIL